MADIKIDDTVDITDVVCPVTFVKAKVALEELDDGQILAIKMNDGERYRMCEKREGRRTSDPEARRQRRRNLYTDRKKS